ncbi:hypothetical protein MKZ38_002377 [Zalerion maritima]|uniref:Uncharacterized protein n=1 Tax=Zalerion maritima TaxID=339359 RepID=A0AAD5RXH1_9PEZI|nr:hypothetical protein MKZ38_002377 [Zalerion maritima]
MHQDFEARMELETLNSHGKMDLARTRQYQPPIMGRMCEPRPIGSFQLKFHHVESQTGQFRRRTPAPAIVCEVLNPASWGRQAASNIHFGPLQLASSNFLGPVRGRDAVSDSAADGLAVMACTPRIGHVYITRAGVQLSSAKCFSDQ